jgi:hypothetical protein
MPAIIYDFRAIGEALRKQRVDDWWQNPSPRRRPWSGLATIRCPPARATTVLLEV